MLTCRSLEIQQRLIDIANKEDYNLTLLTNCNRLASQMQNGVVVDSLSIEAQSQLQSLLGITQSTRQKIAHRRILQWIRRDGMHDRFNVVEDAHLNTFRWLLESMTEVASKDMETARRTRSCITIVRRWDIPCHRQTGFREIDAHEMHLRASANSGGARRMGWSVPSRD
jgi:uncharacterized protein (DUF2235 family)